MGDSVRYALPVKKESLTNLAGGGNTYIECLHHNHIANRTPHRKIFNHMLLLRAVPDTTANF